MATILSLISGIAFLVSVICFILLVVKMFGAGDAGMGILCLVLCLCGIGFFVALILGWINVDKYGARKLMPIYTVAFVLAAVLGGASGYMYQPAIDARLNVRTVQPV